MTLEIIDSGVIGGVKQLTSLVQGMSARNAIVADNCEYISHWWMLKAGDGKEICYFGTKETFDKWCAERSEK